MFDESAFDPDDIGSAAPSPSMSAVSAVPSLFYGTSSPSSSLCPSPTTYAPTNNNSALASPGIPCISLPPTSSSSKAGSDEIKFTRKPSAQNAPVPTTFTTSTPYQSRRRSYPVIRQSQFGATAAKPANQPAEQININGMVHPHSQASAVDSLRKHTNASSSLMSHSTSQTPISNFLNGWFGGSPTQSMTSTNRARSQSHSHSQSVFSDGNIFYPEQDERTNRWFNDDTEGERRGRSATRSNSRDALRRSPRASRSSRKANASRSKSSVRILSPLKQEQSDDTINLEDEVSNKLMISTHHRPSDNDNFDLEATPKLEKKQVVSLND
ncbi:hypothetical protein E3Q18_01851 [Wallemia mellicola]|nr:hypothetical protein E3Q18_01851 [Wallemia mellicola]